MPRNSMLLPVGMVVMIVLVIGVTMLIERTNAPDITADSRYPYQICTFNRYCADSACTDTPLSFVLYFEHENGEPRVEVPGMAPQATLDARADRRVFTSTGGNIRGSITVFPNRTLDLIATSGEESEIVEHFASGTCDRPVTP